MVIGNLKGRTLKERVARKFGSPDPEGYRKALRCMKIAEKFGRPIFTFIDLAGAYPGIGAEERGQGEAIARNLIEMSRLRVPTIATITGEGGSGGALALAVADRVLMLENAIYSVISPEGCASIMWKDANKKQQAAAALKYTATDVVAARLCRRRARRARRRQPERPCGRLRIRRRAAALPPRQPAHALPRSAARGALSQVPQHRAVLHQRLRRRSGTCLNHRLTARSTEHLPLSAPHSTTTQQRTGKAFQLALFGTAVAWSISSSLLSASSARGITNRFNIDIARPLLAALFFLFLLAVGFSLLQTIARRPASARSVLGLPKRPTSGREWLLGAAIGWGMVVLAVLPLALTGSLHVAFWTDPSAVRLIFFNLAAIAAASLAEEVVFRGYPFRLLIEAIGPVGATFGMSLLFGLARALQHGATRTAIFIAMLSGVVFSVAWLRTHGLWLAWGMRFAWIASMGILFGLPVAGVG